MNKLKAGFGRVNINPPLGIAIGGYFVPRHAERILDDLEINAVALEVDNTRVVMLTMDQCGMVTPIVTEFREHISAVTGVELDKVFLHATHSHTTPVMSKTSEDVLLREYYQFVMRRLGDAAQFALDDLKPARMGWAVGKSPKVAFVRRFRMKDGSVKTNPGVGNPDILHPLGDVDERVNVLRFDREGGETIVIANVGNHPDTVGGNNISADWPGMTRRVVEQAIDNTRCIFFNGAQGDVNHVNVHAENGDWNDLFKDFDGVSRGYGHTRHMGRVVAGGVLQVYDKVNYVDVDRLDSLYKVIKAPSNMPKPEELELAHKYHELHKAGKDEEIPFKAMDLTTVVAEAGRMVSLENGPEFFDLGLTGIAIGPVAFLGIPGEPFNGIGLGLKEAKGWDMILPCCQANGREGYFPMMDAYVEGGYEARSSYYKAGIAELLIEEGTKILDTLRG